MTTPSEKREWYQIVFADGSVSGNMPDADTARLEFSHWKRRNDSHPAYQPVRIERVVEVLTRTITKVRASATPSAREAK